MKTQISVYVTAQNVASTAELLALQEGVEMTLSNVVEYALETMAVVAEGRGIMRKTDAEVADVLDRFNILPTQMSMKLNKKLPRKVEALNIAAKSGATYAGAIAILDMSEKQTKRREKAPPKLDMSTLPVVADEVTYEPDPEPPEHLKKVYDEYMGYVMANNVLGRKTPQQLMLEFAQQATPDREIWNEFTTWIMKEMEKKDAKRQA